MPFPGDRRSGASPARRSDRPDPDASHFPGGERFRRTGRTARRHALRPLARSAQHQLLRPTSPVVNAWVVVCVHRPPPPSGVGPACAACRGRAAASPARQRLVSLVSRVSRNQRWKRQSGEAHRRAFARAHPRVQRRPEAGARASRTRLAVRGARGTRQAPDGRVREHAPRPGGRHLRPRHHHAHAPGRRRCSARATSDASPSGSARAARTPADARHLAESHDTARGTDGGTDRHRRSAAAGSPSLRDFGTSRDHHRPGTRRRVSGDGCASGSVARRGRSRRDRSIAGAARGSSPVRAPRRLEADARRAAASVASSSCKPCSWNSADSIVSGHQAIKHFVPRSANAMALARAWAWCAFHPSGAASAPSRSPSTVAPPDPPPSGVRPPRPRPASGSAHAEVACRRRIAACGTSVSR